MVRVLRRSLPVIFASVLFAVGAAAAESWDGTWAGGWENGDGVQIIIAGNEVIGIGRGMDYPHVERSQVSPDGATLNFAWAGGEGTLRRTGARDAAFTMRERGRPERSFAVHRE